MSVLQFQRLSLLSSWWEAWILEGRRGAGGATSSTFWTEGIEEETLFCRQPRGDNYLLWVEPEYRRRPQSPPSQWHFLQTGHTHSNNATPPNSTTPHRPSFQTHEFAGAIPIQTTTPCQRKPWESWFSLFHHVNPEDWTHAIRHGDKCFCCNLYSVCVIVSFIF